MNLKREVIWVVLFVFFCSGCATIIHGTSQEIGISSNPSGAEASLSPGNVKVTTPGTITLKRNKDYAVNVKKDGYEDAGATISSSASGWMWGNILLGGLFGLAIDLASGGGYSLDPQNINVDLKEIQKQISHEGQ